MITDGKNVFRKMDAEQREEVVAWLLNNGLEDVEAFQGHHKTITLGDDAWQASKITHDEIVYWALTHHAADLAEYLDISDAETKDMHALFLTLQEGDTQGITCPWEEVTP